MKINSIASLKTVISYEILDLLMALLAALIARVNALLTELGQKLKNENYDTPLWPKHTQTFGIHYRQITIG